MIESITGMIQALRSFEHEDGYFFNNLMTTAYIDISNLVVGLWKRAFVYLANERIKTLLANIIPPETVRVSHTGLPFLTRKQARRLVSYVVQLEYSLVNRQNNTLVLSSSFFAPFLLLFVPLRHVFVTSPLVFAPIISFVGSLRLQIITAMRDRVKHMKYVLTRLLHQASFW